MTEFGDAEIGSFPSNGPAKIQTFEPFTLNTWNFQNRQIWRKDKIWQNLGVAKWNDSP